MAGTITRSGYYLMITGTTEADIVETLSGFATYPAPSDKPRVTAMTINNSVYYVLADNRGF